MELSDLNLEWIDFRKDNTLPTPGMRILAIFYRDKTPKYKFSKQKSVKIKRKTLLEHKIAIADIDHGYGINLVDQNNNYYSTINHENIIFWCRLSRTQYNYIQHNIKPAELMSICPDSFRSFINIIKLSKKALT